MAEKYSSELLHIVIAQITQTIGYNNTQSAPLELLEDILQRFIKELARDLHSQAEHANRAEPNLKDVILSLKNVNVDVHELLDYIGNVEPVPFVREVPGYPIKKNSNMNFLKPGSAETLTRPVHIFEYLPPMLQNESGLAKSSRCPSLSDHVSSLILEANREVALNFGNKSTVKILQEVGIENGDTLIPKWCNQIDSSMPLSSLSKDHLGPDGHAVREIRSVVMTTGGFISPAIEGKLPEPFVPDIIGKFKGLDAPPASASPEIPDPAVVSELITKSMSVFDSTPRAREHRLLSLEGKTPQDSNETIALEPIPSVIALQNNKASKKSKKKHFIGLFGNDQTKDINTAKAQEKAQRKALKMYQKLSKSQVDGSNKIGLKKSMKNLNRGILSALPDGSTERIHLEKLMKKQSKQRQKHLKSQKHQRHQESAFKMSGTDPDVSLFPVATSLIDNIPNNDLVFGSPSLDLPLIEKKDKLPSDFCLSTKEITSIETHGIADEIKVASEPDRTKLNIFKKISKQKASKAISPNSLNIATNLFVSHGAPLISLPSGTTITPAPTLSVQENVNMPAENLIMPAFQENEHSFGAVSVPFSTTANLLTIDMNKSKKRGRKPGGKNHPKPQTSSSVTTSVHSPKKLKANKININLSSSLNLSMHETLVPTLSLPMEPLNLSQVDQLKGTQLQNISDHKGFCRAISSGGGIASAANDAFTENLIFQKTKEKKERKKNKSKYSLDGNFNAASPVSDNSRGFNNMTYMDIEKQKSTYNSLIKETAGFNEKNLHISKKQVINTSPPIIGAHGYVASLGPVSNLSNSTSMYPSNQPNIMPMLPLLHFAPRPGLIPSGPGLFSPTTLTNFPKKVHGTTSSNMIIPHSFISSASAGQSTTIGPTPSHIERNNSTTFSDTRPERSYCNVAPLVPESMTLMTLTTAQIDTISLKPADLHISDAQFNTESRENEINHTSQFSKCTPLMQRVRSLGVDELLVAHNTQPNKIIKPTTPGTGNLGDPIEVSDDSTDDEPNKLKLQNVACFSHAHAVKTGIIQTANISNVSGIQHIDSLNNYSMITNTSHLLNSDSKHSKKISKSASLKISQPDGNLPIISPSSHPSPFNINFVGSDKFSLAGGADLIPLSRVDSGLAYSSQAVPVTSLAAGATSGSVASQVPDDQKYTNSFVGSVNYDDITITPTNSVAISEIKLRKIHKKLKKPKEGKLKKKKDKKDKTKNREKIDEKDLFKIEKTKSQDKKMKRGKKREKQTTPDRKLSKENLEYNMDQTNNVAPVLGPVTVAVEEDIPSTVPLTTLAHHLPSPKLDNSPNQVPKLTLKLSGKTTPISNPFEDDPDLLITHSTALTPMLTKREHSPELARFSPLVTGPPKPKQCEIQNLCSTAPSSVSTPNTTQSILMLSNTHPTGPCNSSGWMPAGTANASATLSASSVLLPQQLLQASKSIPKTSLTSSIHNCGTALVSQIKIEESQVTTKNADSNRPSSYVDAEGYRIWICPACGKVDDGSAMIGCDGCDAWYHWICVGIFVAPNDNEDWFCRVCVTKKKIIGSEKKKKRNKKK